MDREGGGMWVVGVSMREPGMSIRVWGERGQRKKDSKWSFCFVFYYW